jgi:hypothetical protein
MVVGSQLTAFEMSVVSSEDRLRSGTQDNLKARHVRAKRGDLITR